MLPFPQLLPQLLHQFAEQNNIPIYLSPGQGGVSNSSPPPLPLPSASTQACQDPIPHISGWRVQLMGTTPLKSLCCGPGIEPQATTPPPKTSFFFLTWDSLPA